MFKLPMTNCKHAAEMKKANSIVRLLSGVVGADGLEPPTYAL
tara:strand:+ start:232 stop:357 length:126 start_codon:yes stop_codon:yes gene_type:complete